MTEASNEVIGAYILLLQAYLPTVPNVSSPELLTSFQLFHNGDSILQFFD
jgi:hypothetical protein